MANTIPNRQAICDTLLARAAQDKDIVVLCSDSRGSASLSRFADTFPDQFVEVGIAEQDLVSIAAGLARCGKRPLRRRPPASCPPAAMNRPRWTAPTPTPTLPLSAFRGASATVLWA